MAASNSRSIAFITTIADTQWHFLRGQNRFLTSQGFQVHAIAAPGPLLQKLRERDAVHVHAVPMSRSVQPLRDVVAIVRLYRNLRRIQPDVVHVSTPKAALLGAIAALVARVPVRVFLVRGLSFDGARGWRRRALALLERLTAALCHRTLFVSHSTMRLAEADRMIPIGSGRVPGAGMSNGIDTRRFDARTITHAPLPFALTDEAGRPRPVIGFAGRLARDKGIDQLAIAWRRIRDVHSEARLLLVGDWDTARPVDPAVRDELERDERVHITGSVAQVGPYYRAMTVFVFPSRRGEGFPNAPMEAAAMELPVVATSAIGNVDAVVQGVTGTLVPCGDPVALAAAIARYLASPELCRRHGRAGRQRVLREFRQERVWNAMLNEIEELFAQSGLPAPAAVPALALRGEAA
jgi:glycosyltransferase involved in cell wall biosynthesis